MAPPGRSRPALPVLKTTAADLTQRRLSKAASRAAPATGESRTQAATGLCLTHALRLGAASAALRTDPDLADQEAPHGADAPYLANFARHVVQVVAVELARSGRSFLRSSRQLSDNQRVSLIPVPAGRTGRTGCTCRRTSADSRACGGPTSPAHPEPRLPLTPAASGGTRPGPRSDPQGPRIPARAGRTAS